MKSRTTFTLDSTNSSPNAGGGADRRTHTYSTPAIHRLQFRHYLLLNLLPSCGALAAIALAFVVPVGALEIGLLVAMTVLTGVGITSGFHRYFAHRTFEAKPWVRVLLQVLGCMAAQGGALSWACIHRRHHDCADGAGDPHSPNLHGPGGWNRVRGLIHAHLTWMKRHDYPNVVRYAPDLLADKLAMRIDTYYYWFVALGLSIPAIICGLARGNAHGMLMGFLWGGVVRLVLVDHVIWSINSLHHAFGTRRFDTPERSRNGALFCLLSLGESWHNNHHAFPGSAWFGLAWYRPDPGYWFIRLLELAGGVANVHVPSRARIDTYGLISNKETSR
jgi:stearoyl-CoA desaturase (delta-9 desaturase)